MIVGRDSSLSVAESLIHVGASIDVVGGRFSGRSAFLGALQQRLVAGGWRIVQVRGVASLRQHPLAAMHLAGIGGPADTKTASTIQSTAESLRKATNEPKSVLFLDDWDDLDEASWGVAELIRRTTGLPIVLSRLQGLRARHTPSGLVASTLEPSYVIEMAPIRFEELEQAMTAHIGGPIDAGTMSRIYAKSGGIIGLARGLVDAAMREGRMTKSPSGWAAVRDLWSPGLAGIVEGHLENLGDDARDALEVIALVGLADVDTVRKLISWETLELLEERTMVKFVASGTRQLVSVVPPLLVEFFRHQPLAARRIRLTELIVARLGSDSQANVVVANMEQIAPEVGEADALFVRLLRERARTRRIVAGAEWAENPKPRTAANYITALLQSDEGHSMIEEVVAKTKADAGDAAGRAEFAVMRADWLALVNGDLDAGLQLLAGEVAQLGEHGRILDAAAVRLETMLRGVPEDFPARLEVTDGLPEPVAAALLETQMLVLITQARFADARRAFESLGKTRGTNPSTPANQLFGWVLLGEGRFAEAVRWASRGLDESNGLLDLDGTFAHGYLLALASTFEGDYDEAERVLDTLFAIGDASPLLVHIQLGLLSIGSVISFRRGNIALAERYLADLDNLRVSSGPLPGQALAWPRAQHTAFVGGPKSASSALWAAGQKFWDVGYRFNSLLMLLTSAEIDSSARHLKDLKAKVAEVDGDFLHSLIEFIDARESRSASRLLEAADLIESTGRPGLALNALRLAVDLARATGDRPTVRAAEAKRHRVNESLGSRQIDTTRFLATAVMLTDREMEIATMIAQGYPNPEIAVRLVLSVRTVESHIHRILRKANLVNRSELIDFVNNLER